MAITYTNIFEDRIYDPMKVIIAAEFTRETGLDPNNIKFGVIEQDDLGMADGGFLTIVPVLDEHLIFTSNQSERDYTIELTYYRIQTPRVEYDILTDFAEHLRQLLDNNSDNQTNWCAGRVVSVDYEQVIELDFDPDEEIDNLSIVKITWTGMSVTARV